MFTFLSFDFAKESATILAGGPIGYVRSVATELAGQRFCMFSGAEPTNDFQDLRIGKSDVWSSPLNLPNLNLRCAQIHLFRNPIQGSAQPHFLRERLTLNPCTHGHLRGPRYSSARRTALEIARVANWNYIQRRVVVAVLIRIGARAAVGARNNLFAKISKPALSNFAVDGAVSAAFDELKLFAT